MPPRVRCGGDQGPMAMAVACLYRVPWVGRVAIVAQGAWIAVVDDDPLVCRALSRLLRSAGFEARIFGSAAELLASGFARQASFFVVDVHLGATTGFELVESLRVHGPCAPVVFITAFDDEVTRKRAQAAACGYLRKPFHAGELLDLVQAALGRACTA